MTSMNMERHLDEQPPAKKPRIGDSIGEQQQGSEQPPANGMKADEQKEELETSTTTMVVDLPRPRHRKLPAELNQQIFLCFNPATQLKFIAGLGWDFYAMFRYKLLKKSKRVRNPQGNRWNRTNTRAAVAADGLNVSNGVGIPPNVFAVQPFPISGPHCREDEFPGTICYYYEVKVKGYRGYIGLSDDAIPINNPWTGQYSNSYAIRAGYSGYYDYDVCWLAGRPHRFELPEGARAIPPRLVRINVYGCGLVLDPEDKLWVFFTLNGKLMGRKIQISPTVDRLFSAVTMDPNGTSFEANFGDNPAKPFEYDIKNCPGLGLACI